MHLLAQDARAWVEFKKGLEDAGAIPGLFQQLAPRTLARGFPPFHATGHKFPQGFFHGVPVLADQDQAAVGETGNDDDRTCVANNFARGLASPGSTTSLNFQIHHFSTVDGFAA